MRKKSVFIGTIVSLSLLASSCSYFSKDDSPEYPEAPADGQVYKHNGTSSIWNAALGYWAISSIMNGRSVNHRYYPNTQTYTNATGSKINTPVYAKNSKGRGVTKRGFGSTSRGRAGA